jgi:hypothetical protein
MCVALPPTTIVLLNLTSLAFLWRISKLGAWSPGAIARATSTCSSYPSAHLPLPLRLCPLPCGTAALVTLAQKLCPSSLPLKLTLALKQRMIMFVMLANWVSMFIFPLIPHNLEPSINLIWYIVTFGPHLLLVCLVTNIISLFLMIVLMMFGHFRFDLSLTLLPLFLTFLLMSAHSLCNIPVFPKPKNRNWKKIANKLMFGEWHIGKTPM